MALLPNDYCDDPKLFGRAGYEVPWSIPASGTRHGLWAAVLQHHAAGRLREALDVRGLTHAAYADLTGGQRGRVTDVLGGARRMQFRDLALAARLGPDALPDADESSLAVRAVQGGRRPRTRQPAPPLFEFRAPSGAGAPRETDEADVAGPRPYTDEEESRWRHQEHALRGDLTTYLRDQAAFEQPVEIRLRRSAERPVRAFVFQGAGKTFAFVTALEHWMREVRAGRAGVVAGAFVLDCLDTDEEDRPRSAVALRPAVDAGRPVLIDCRVDIDWARSHRPELRWHEADGPFD